MKVHHLIDMLKKLPPNTPVFTCGLEGVYPAEGGNLFPIKVLVHKFGIGIYFDDGLCQHDEIMNEWIPLDEYVGTEDSPPKSS